VLIIITILPLWPHQSIQLKSGGCLVQKFWREMAGTGIARSKYEICIEDKPNNFAWAMTT
jgi:hypothetical protein